MLIRERLICLGTGILIGILVSSIACAWLWPVRKIQEAAAPAARQADGSLIAERDPKAKLKRPHQVPHGARVEREIRVDVQPTGRPDCPVCTVDLSLVKLPDATHRVVASSPTGEVINALDLPRVPALIERERRWSGGVLYNGRWGALVTRDIGFLTVGAAVTTDKFDGVAPWAVLAIRF